MAKRTQKKSGKRKKVTRPKASAKKRATRKKTSRKTRKKKSIWDFLFSGKLKSKKRFQWFGMIALGVIILGVGAYFSSKVPEGRTPASHPRKSYFKKWSELQPPEPMFGGELSWNFKKVHSKDIGGRIDYWSQFLISKKKLPFHSPKISDNAPFIPKRFDCTTYVETVLALARSSSEKDFQKELLKIRYRNGVPTFENRNHFPSVDWNPNNQKSGVLRDVTRWVAIQSGADFKFAKKTIDRKGWLDKQIQSGNVTRQIASVAERSWERPIQANVPYIPLNEIDSVLQNIPNGTVLNLVRESDPGKPVLISHQGLVIKKGKRVYLRHSRSGLLRTHTLAKYLKTQKKKYWPIVGINLNAVNDSY